MPTGIEGQVDAAARCFGYSARAQMKLRLAIGHIQILSKIETDLQMA